MLPAYENKSTGSSVIAQEIHTGFLGHHNVVATCTFQILNENDYSVKLIISPTVDSHFTFMPHNPTTFLNIPLLVQLRAAVARLSRSRFRVSVQSASLASLRRQTPAREEDTKGRGQS